MRKKVASFIILVLSDLLVIVVSFWVAYLIRRQILPHIFTEFKGRQLFPFSVFLSQYYLTIIWIIVFAYERLYTKRYLFWQEAKVLLKSATISSTLIILMIFITRQQIKFSRTIVVSAWLISLFLFPLFRYYIKILLVKTNLWKRKILILGVHQTSFSILKNIRKNKTTGYEVLGFLDNDQEKIGKKFGGVKVIGNLSDIENITKKYQSKDLMITTPHLPRRKLKELLLKYQNISDSMWLIPRSGDFITEGVELEVIGDVLTLYIKKNLVRPWNTFIKNLFDKVITLILIVLFLPLFLVIAFSIKLDSEGPIIFIQKRLGKGKKIFNLFKFRSMFVNSDKRLAEYLNDNERAREEWEKYKKLKKYDPRVTRMGKIIRRYSLDELPQLFNVLIGKMSLVGPRPYLYEELKEEELFTNIIAKVRPGITGLWQISGRSELSFQDRLSLDEYYIRNWSLWLDTVILIKSIKALFSSKGAY
jgi:Undecaprenyl-phosphate galactose phosphotransferase WbaP